MDAAVSAHIRQLLLGRREAIAEGWQRAVEDTRFAPHGEVEVGRHLLALTDQAIALLLGEPYERQEARAIGAAVARLHYVRPAALSRTLDVLARELGAGLSTEDVAALQPRLATLLGELAAGYYAAAREAILAEQETIRGALLLERHRAQEALRRSEERFRALVRHAPDIVAIADPAGTVRYVSPAVERILDYRPEDVIGAAAFHFLPPEEVARAMALRDAVLQGAGPALAIELCARHRDGSRRDLEVIATLLPDELDAGGIVVNCRDITERRRAEERLGTVVTHAPLILFACDRAGVITLLEGRGLATLGYRPGELVGESVWARAIDVPGLVGNLRRALAGEDFAATTEVRGVVFETRYAPLRDADGTVVGVIGVATDITARVRAEAAVRRFEAGLTPMERRVLPLLARADLTNYRQIGALLHIDRETVRDHMRGIARKLGVAEHREVVVAAARQRGLLPPAA